jgi:hypothetical protein
LERKDGAWDGYRQLQSCASISARPPSLQCQNQQLTISSQGHHLDHHRLPMHHCQASYHLERSVLQHLVPPLFPNTVLNKQKLIRSTVLHQQPTSQSTQMPPSPLRLEPPLSQPASQPPPKLRPTPATRLWLSPVLPLLVSSASLPTSCKQLTSFRQFRSSGFTFVMVGSKRLEVEWGYGIMAGI